MRGSKCACLGVGLGVVSESVLVSRGNRQRGANGRGVGAREGGGGFSRRFDNIRTSSKVSVSIRSARNSTTTH